MIRKKFILQVTSLCNENCGYCLRNKKVGNLPQKEVNILIKKYIPLLKDFVEIATISGGEIGLLKEEIINYIFDEMPFTKFGIATNGLFLDNPAYLRNKKRISSLAYHVRLLRNIKYENISNAKYTFVINKLNIHLIENFLKRYNSIIFYPLLNVYQEYSDKKNKLEKEDIQTAYNIIKNFDNIPDSFKKSIELLTDSESSEYLSIKNSLIKIKPRRIRINFARNRIDSCCAFDNDEDSYEINEENIKLMKEGKLIYKVNNETCTWCLSRHLLGEEQ
jgi:hypothetical protein